MPSDDEILVKNLSARLSEEIANLPRDGNGSDHALTIKIKGNRGHINLGHHTHHCTKCDHNPHNHQHTTAQTKQPLKEKNSAQILKLFAVCLGVALLSFFVREFMPGA